MLNASTCDYEGNSSCKIDEYLGISIQKKFLFGKLVLACEDEILKTTETSLDDKKVTREKVIAVFILFHW